MMSKPLSGKKRDMAKRRNQPTLVKCWVCRGFGIVNIGVKDATCLNCKGKGKIKAKGHKL